MPNPVKTAPVTTVTAVEAVVGALLAFLVAHGVIDTDVASTYGPAVVLVLVAAFGAVKWRNVTPVAKVEDLLERDGLLTDADVARLEGFVVDLLGSHHVPEHAADDDPEPADGMAAGAPVEA